MKKYNLGNLVSDDEIDLFASSDMIKEFDLEKESQQKQFIFDTLFFFIDSNSHIKKLMNLYLSHNNLQNQAILAAHGGSDGYRWLYADGEKLRPVQTWINRNDGNYGTLLLCCCNSGAHEIRSRKSAILVPNQDYSGERQYRSEVQIELYLPKIGYVSDLTEEYCRERILENPHKSI